MEKKPKTNKQNVLSTSVSTLVERNKNTEPILVSFGEIIIALSRNKTQKHFKV